MFSKCINKYKRMTAPVKAAFWFTICNFMQRGISMITTPIFTRMLPTEEYGLYSTYLSWENVLLMVVSLCLFKSVMNLYIEYEDQERVLSVICGLEIILGGIWLVIGCVFRAQFATLLGLSPVLVICLFVYFVFQSAFQCWALYKRYIYDYKILVIVTLVLTASSSLLGVAAILLSDATAEARAISATAVVTFVGIILYYSIFKRSKCFYDKKIWLFALGFCIPLMPHYLSEIVLQSSDKIMINYMCGARDVAIYSIAYSVGSLISLFTTAINSSFAPYQYQKIKSGEFSILAKRANQILLFVGIMLVAIMLFSREIVLIFGGYKYLDSVQVIIPICIGAFFNYMFQLFARVQEYYERKLTVVIPSILCAALNLVLNYIFIRLFGYQAAAYTTFACYFIFCIIHYFFYRKVCQKILEGRQLYNIKGLIFISVGVILSGCVIALVNQISWLKYIMLGIIMCITFFKRTELLKYFKGIKK